MLAAAKPKEIREWDKGDVSYRLLDNGIVQYWAGKWVDYYYCPITRVVENDGKGNITESLQQLGTKVYL